MHDNTPGRTAHVAVTFPGRLTVTALIVALSEPEAGFLAKMADQLQQPDNVEFKARFEGGALHISLEMDTEDHADHLHALKPAPIEFVNAPLSPEDAAALIGLSGTGGLVGLGCIGFGTPVAPPEGEDAALEPPVPEDPSGFVDPT